MKWWLIGIGAPLLFVYVFRNEIVFALYRCCF